MNVVQYSNQNNTVNRINKTTKSTTNKSEIDYLDVLQAPIRLSDHKLINIKTETSSNDRQLDLKIKEEHSSQITLTSYVNLLRFTIFNEIPNESLVSDFKILLQMKDDDLNLKNDLVKVINQKNYELFRSIIDAPKDNIQIIPEIDAILEIYFKHADRGSAFNVLDHLLEIRFDDESLLKIYLKKFSQLPQNIQGINRGYRA